jgi:sulfite reductase (NADPH) hemoprotein beta-component
MSLSSNELLKSSSPTLAGTIRQTLDQKDVDRFSEDDVQFLKFHGIYQQDDRDLRKSGKKYIFMVRLRLPGGAVTPEQYLACDELASRHGNNTLRITSRQSLQFHGVVKSGLGPLMKGLNDTLITTLAACGDVNRNVLAPPTPATNELGEQVREDARSVAAALSPSTKAYHSIWVEGVELNLEDEANKDFIDPLYGKTYLPRKFKIGFAIPPVNDVDIFTNCCGFIAVADSEGKLLGYNLAAGGGMGRSHNNEATFPRMADVIGFLTPNRVVEIAKTVVTIHRDFGDRANRKHARLKYVLAERGPVWFRGELEKRLGFMLQEARPFQFERQGDRFGWHEQADGRLFLGLFVETGRIKDRPGCQLKTALRQVVEKYRPELRFTPGNNVLLVNIAPALREEITALFAEQGVSTEAGKQASVLRRASMACVALPTCGLALAESERYLPRLLNEIEQLLSQLGLSEEEITIRMTGCPNGCARPYMAEIGLVGKAPGRYQLYFGGSQAGTRINRLYKDNVKDVEIIKELRPVLARFQESRLGQERFGDWVERILWPEGDPGKSEAQPNLANVQA